MKDYVISLIQKYRNIGVIIDTNILLLYFVGTVDSKMITSFKRTYSKFTEEDYLILMELLRNFDKAITTPNILTEVSNLLNQLPNDFHPAYFARFAQEIITFDEQYTKSATISAIDEFIKFGLTDSGIIHLAKENFLVITEDFKLAQYLQKLGVDVLNFNHLRTLSWGLG